MKLQKFLIIFMVVFGILAFACSAKQVVETVDRGHAIYVLLKNNYELFFDIRGQIQNVATAYKRYWDNKNANTADHLAFEVAKLYALGEEFSKFLSSLKEELGYASDPDPTNKNYRGGDKETPKSPRGIAASF